MRTSNSLARAMGQFFMTFAPHLLAIEQPVHLILDDKIMVARRKPWNDKTSRMTGLDLICRLMDQHGSTTTRVRAFGRINS